MNKYMLHHYLEDTVARYPERPAVKFGANSLTYEGLWKKSLHLSGLLANAGVKPGNLVAVYLNKSIEAVVSMFGVLISGGAYIPLDSHYSPVGRIAGIIKQSGASFIITSRVMWDSLNENIGEEYVQKNLKIIFIDEEWTGDTYYARKGTDSDLAYILYTSGSTGVPKGVMLSHLNAMTFVNWALDYFKPTCEWNFSNFAPLHFDLSVFDIYVSAACGGCLHLLPFEIGSNPRAIVKWINENSISCMYSVPSLWVALLTHGNARPEDFYSINRVLFAGEVFAPKYLKQLMETIPHAVFYNLYGPTETNVCTCYKVNSKDEVKDRPVPIGQACANTEVFALDENDMPIKEGGEGELYVKGSIVMQGYHKQPELTASVFRKSPIPHHHGALAYRTGDIVKRIKADTYEFLGRKDNMVKCSGFRIELSEIETALLKSEQIKEAAVVALYENESGKNTIHAVITLNDGYSLSVIKMKNYLAGILPKYMLPDTIVSIDEMPKNSNGKTDRQKLVQWIRENSSI